MSNLSHLGIKLPWYSDEYLDSLKERFPEIVGDMTRQELFKTLYENVDRESPRYEYEISLAAEVYEILNSLTPIEGVDTEVDYVEEDFLFQSKDQKLLTYLFSDLSKINIERLTNIIIESVENLSLAYLVLGSFDSEFPFDLSGFEESKDIYHISFVSNQGLGESASSLEKSKPLLALSLVLEENNFIALDTHLIRRYSDGSRTYIQNKLIDFNQFVDFFNKAKLDI